MNKNRVAEKMHDLFKNNQFHVLYTSLLSCNDPSEKDLANCVGKLEEMLSKLSKSDINDYIDAFFDTRVHEKDTIDDAILSIASAILHQFADQEATDKCFSKRVRLSTAFYMQLGKRKP